MACSRFSANCKAYLQEPLKVPVCDQDPIAPPPGLESVVTAKMSGLATPKPDIAPPSPEEQYKAAVLANQSAALALENARLQQELILMRLQSQTMMTMPYAPLGFNGAFMAPWAAPMTSAAHVHDIVAPKTSKKRGAKKAAKNLLQEKTEVRGFDSRSRFESASTASGEDSISSPSQTASDDEQDTVTSAKSEEQVRTTVMLRNVPSHVSVEQLLEVMNEEGFVGCYNLVYLPMDFKTKLGLGYAFVDLKSMEHAQSFFKIFQGFSKWAAHHDKVCEVAWSALQGIDEHIERYRNSPVMHESVADDFRPVLFKNCKRVPFPAPTKRIRAPRQWSRRH